MFEAVSDQKDQAILMFGEAMEEADDFHFGERVEAAGDFIAEHQGRVADQLEREGEAAALASGKDAGFAVGDAGEFDFFENALDERFPLRAGEAADA